MPVVVAGVTTCQGGREGRPQGEGAQVTGHHEPEGNAKCKVPRRCWVSSVNAAGAACRATNCTGRCSTSSLYLLAYGRIYANHGAMTPGASAETADGMSEEKIGADHRGDAPRALPLQSGPADVHPEKERENAPAGNATWSDKLVGEVVRLLLEAYYEPQFSDHSHGFRPGRGCHTALRDSGERPGPGQPGSSRETFPTASGAWTTR